MKRILTIVIIFIVIVIGIQLVSDRNQTNNNPPPSKTELNNTQDNADQEQVQGAQFGIPQQLRIPQISVEAAVEQVGLDAERKMDVPKNVDNVGWYNLGYRPGENGNAVLAGHFDKADGSPAVFWDVEKLRPGDKISIDDANGKTYTFEVEKVERFPYNNFPIQEVFGVSNEPRLNLITCQGDWDAATRNYSHRVVVFAKQIQT